jgi:hypothetical protein
MKTPKTTAEAPPEPTSHPGRAGATGWWLVEEKGLKVAIPMASTQAGARGPFRPAGWTYNPEEALVWVTVGPPPLIVNLQSAIDAAASAGVGIAPPQPWPETPCATEEGKAE